MTLTMPRSRQASPTGRAWRKRRCRCDASSAGGDLAELIEGRVQDTGDPRVAVGDDESVEIDQTVALAFVVGCHAGAHRQFVADAGRREVDNSAADMDPGR